MVELIRFCSQSDIHDIQLAPGNFRAQSFVRMVEVLVGEFLPERSGFIIRRYFALSPDLVLFSFTDEIRAEMHVFKRHIMTSLLPRLKQITVVTDQEQDIFSTWLHVLRLSRWLQLNGRNASFFPNNIEAKSRRSYRVLWATLVLQRIGYDR